MKKDLIIFIDRDKTLIYDNKLYLGHTNDWKKKVVILPGTIDGIKKINKKFPEAKIYMITNQSGVAISNFKLLTEKRSKQVCEYVIDRYKKKGARIDGYAISGVVNQGYVKRRPMYRFIKKLVGNFSTIKPKTGMIKSIFKEFGILEKNSKIYVLGDRYIDVATALNAKGFGILIPFLGETKSEKRLRQYIKGNKKKNTYVAKNFIDACNFIIKREK